ncbi:MAG TPA: GNAT family N-acetyltransferase [Flavobacterium sp.]|jgi:GNAT superfamily N-acetyltransferase
MLRFIKTDSSNSDFQSLVAMLNQGLVVTDGDEFEFFAQFNKLDSIKNVLVAYNEVNEAVGCGAFKEYAPNVAEIKRMFVQEQYRGRRIAAQILDLLEEWAFEMGYKVCILETSVALPSAVRLYEREGYNRIGNYGQYIGVASSICMSKNIKNQK